MVAIVVILAMRVIVVISMIEMVARDGSINRGNSM